MGPRGRIVLVGIHEKPMDFDPTSLLYRETTIIGSSTYTDDDYRAVIDAMSGGAFDPAGWVEIRPLEELLTAFDDLRDGGPSKVLIDLHPPSPTPRTPTPRKERTMADLHINTEDITLNEEDKLTDVANRYQLPDMYAPADEEYSPWIFVEGSEGMWARYLWFDIRQGQWAAMVRSDGPGSARRAQAPIHGPGLHRQRLVGLRGVRLGGQGGDVVQESPGTIHTLRSVNPEGFLAFFVLNGSIDWYAPDGQHRSRRGRLLQHPPLRDVLQHQGAPDQRRLVPSLTLDRLLRDPTRGRPLPALDVAALSSGMSPSRHPARTARHDDHSRARSPSSRAARPASGWARHACSPSEGPRACRRAAGRRSRRGAARRAAARARRDVRTRCRGLLRRSRPAGHPGAGGWNVAGCRRARPEAFARVIDVNLLAVHRCCRRRRRAAVRRRWLDRADRLDVQLLRVGDESRVCSEQGRDRAAHQVAVSGVRGSRRQGQCHRTRLDQHARCST